MPMRLSQPPAGRGREGAVPIPGKQVLIHTGSRSRCWLSGLAEVHAHIVRAVRICMREQRRVESGPPATHTSDPPPPPPNPPGTSARLRPTSRPTPTPHGGNNGTHSHAHTSARERLRACTPSNSDAPRAARDPMDVLNVEQ